MDSDSDSDSFIVPHGHLSDDELNEDEQQQVNQIFCLSRFSNDKQFDCFFQTFLSQHQRNKRVKLQNHMFGIKKLHDEHNRKN